MKVVYPLYVFVIFLSCSNETPSNLMLLDSKIPTDTPLIFAEGIVSTHSFEFAITFSPEMDEIYFTRRKPEEDNEIYAMRLRDGKWSKPEPAFFSPTEGWDFEPHISPKGDKLYFGSTRPLPDATKSNGLHQWYSKKEVNGWSSPLPLEKPFMDRSVIMYLTSSENGNLYFTTGEKGDKPEDWVIYKSVMEDGQYKSIDRMGQEFNATGKWIAHSYIAPDESFMIYDFKSDLGFGASDLYISFNKNDEWTVPLNLGPKINTEQTEMTPSVSPDGNFLFFHRGREDNGDIYWVDFKQIKASMEKKLTVN
ncbi:TolB family protein [Maribacter sp. CXY002]|uniref:TolB family protein n=1 Tax=Maribacter luteocoastalis TaxID=3407671 RepID=UPI003B67E02F